MDPRPVGLTGSIASGKSTVLAMLEEMGLRVASSDLVARGVFREPEVQTALATRLGIGPPVEPSVLREAMLADSSLRRWTNRLMHPLVGARMNEIAADVVEVPLLFEACLQSRYREVWVVACGAEERKRRLHGRYGPETDLKAYARWQLSEDVKIALADLVVRTDRPLEDVRSILMSEAAQRFPERLARTG